jgi:hypothetical protein
MQRLVEAAAPPSYVHPVLYKRKEHPNDHHREMRSSQHVEIVIHDSLATYTITCTRVVQKKSGANIYIRFIAPHT